MSNSELKVSHALLFKGLPGQQFSSRVEEFGIKGFLYKLKEHLSHSQRPRDKGMTPVFCMVVWVNGSIACSPCDPCEEEEPADRSLTRPCITYIVPSYVTVQ